MKRFIFASLVLLMGCVCTAAVDTDCKAETKIELVKNSATDLLVDVVVLEFNAVAVTFGKEFKTSKQNDLSVVEPVLHLDRYLMQFESSYREKLNSNLWQRDHRKHIQESQRVQLE